MGYYRKKLLAFWALLFVVCGLQAQPLPVGKAYAKNSINGTIFRKNSVCSYEDTQFVAYYDSSAHVVLAKRSLGSAQWEVHRTNFTGDLSDAHRSISLAVDGQGFIHLAWDHHGNALNYAKSREALSLHLVKQPGMLGKLEQVVTYPEFYRMPGGDLLFIYRDGWSGNANCVLNRYDVAKQKWVRLHDNLLNGEQQRSAYWQACVDKQGKLHVSWVWRESSDVSSNHDMCYAQSADGGKTWTKSTGESYHLPITAGEAEYIGRIPQEHDLINQTSMYATADGKTYIATYCFDSLSGRPQYQILFQDRAGTWQQRVFSQRKTSFSLAGWGTKKLPLSRPQILVEEKNEKVRVLMVYRDNERGAKVSLNICDNLEADSLQIQTYDVSDFSVGDWEPSYDTDLWKEQGLLHLYVQNMLQGDGETLSELAPQPVYVWPVNLADL